MSKRLQEVYDKLMGTSGIIAKLIKLIDNKPAVQQEILVDAFLPFAVVNENYPKRVIDFIMNGNDSGILLDLEGQVDTKLIALIESPGTVSWWHSNNDIQEGTIRKFLKRTSSARGRLYTLWDKEFTNQQIIRFAKVLAATCGGKNTSVTTNNAPLWLLYLMFDGLNRDIGNLKDEQFKQLRGRWSLAKLHELLELEQPGSGEQVLNVIFDRRDIDSYYVDYLKGLFRLPDTEDYITAHMPAFLALPAQLSAAGQVCQVQFLAKYPKLAQAVPELIVKQATSALKTVRSAAEMLLPSLSPEALQEPLKQALFHGDTKQRSFAASLIARQAENKHLLEEALAQEKSKAVIAAIESALSRFESLDSASRMAELVIPTCTPIAQVALDDKKLLVLLHENYQQMLAEAKSAAEEEIKRNQDADKRYRYHWAQDNYKRLEKVDTSLFPQIVEFISHGTDTRKKYFKDATISCYKQRIYALENFNFVHYLRCAMLNDSTNQISAYQVFAEPERLRSLDLRQIAQALDIVGVTNGKRLIANYFLSNSYYDPFDLFDHNDLVWPFFAENTDFLDEALHLIPPQDNSRHGLLEVGPALAVLKKFPSIPAQYVPRILEIALGEGKLLRPIAQHILENIPDIHLRAEEALQSAKQDIRITAAEWLVSLKSPTSSKPLYEALKKEKRETVRAAFLTALEALGEDISPYLSPKVLLDEAEKGLKAKAPTSFAWFDFSLLPKVTWSNGQALDSKIIQWWIILAVKLKDPAGNALLQRYVGLLSKDSQQALGAFLLQSFIQQDTRNPSLEEAIAEAQQRAPQQLINCKNWFKRYPEYYAKYENFTLEDTIEEIKREVLSRYLGSANSDKGMLALCFGVEGHIAVSAIRNFMRDHYPRYNQINAMLMAIGNSNDPVIIQLLLSVSRRYRTNAVQEKAHELIANIAQRNGWTADELADRTIPTAGMDESGIISLDYGERVFTARMDDKYKLLLINPEGKEIKALPEPRKTEDAELAKEAKKQLSNSKKELKQVIDLQTARLFEGMCAERKWPVADWQEYLHAHPVMNALIQRLVWLELDATGNQLNSFRPTEDGSLINLEDDELELNANSYITLAHAALLTKEQGQAWLAHFKDYKVKPLFIQMLHNIPDISQAKDNQIEDRKGWVTDTFTLRGILTKLGYKRSDAEDGGSFDHYIKAFDSLGLYINIYFSGSYLPEENIPAVLYSLCFTDSRGWRAETQALATIPPVLLAEGYADYLAVAQACSGFDPEWQKKALW